MTSSMCAGRLNYTAHLQQPLECLTLKVHDIQPGYPIADLAVHPNMQ